MIVNRRTLGIVHQSNPKMNKMEYRNMQIQKLKLCIN